MLPINDTEPNRYGRSYMTIVIILINIAVYAYQLNYAIQNGNESYWAFIRTFGITPQLIFTRQGAGLLSAFTSMFMHGDFSHIFFNMLALWVFGRRVEDACGPFRFLIFYLCCGLMADYFALFTQPTSLTPAIGASGAVFGMEGAYLMLYPSGRIRTLILWFVPLWPRIPAILIILYQLPFQLLPAFNVLLNGADYNIGYWAHLGGFFGSIIIVFFLRPQASVRFWKSLPI